MSNGSVLGKGMTEERHIFGLAASTAHTARGAKWGGLWGAVLLLLVTTVSVGPAWAHGTAGGAEEGYVFVQQALGHLAHDPGPKGVAAADAKIWAG